LRLTLRTPGPLAGTSSQVLPGCHSLVKRCSSPARRLLLAAVALMCRTHADYARRGAAVKHAAAARSVRTH
jgi:hypothetical protein